MAATSIGLRRGWAHRLYRALVGAAVTTFVDGGPLGFTVFNSELFNSPIFNQENKPMLNLSDAIAAAQAAKKAVAGADAAVATEQADVAAEIAILTQKQDALKDAVAADDSAKLDYKGSLNDLIDSAKAELSGL